MATKQDDQHRLAEEWNPHAAAFVERQKAPALYEDPTIATPGKLRDVEDFTGPVALVSVDEEVGENDPSNPVDTSVDNRSEVQAVLELGEEDLETKLQNQLQKAEQVAEEQSDGQSATDLGRAPVRQQGAVKKPRRTPAKADS